jgi:hypothetical protein
MKSSVFWNIMLCSLLNINRRFEGRYESRWQADFHAGFLLGLFFNLEDGGDMFLRNVG